MQKKGDKVFDLHKEKRKSMIRQLSVFVENKPGSFLRVTKALHERGIALQGFCSVDSPEFGILRIVLDRPEEAQRLLDEEGFMAKCYDVIAVEIGEQDTIDALLKACCESNISVNYMYSAFGDGCSHSVAILYSEYLDETEEMLRGKGFNCLNKLA